MGELRRVLGVGGATVVGLGAMLGTGVFAAWTPATAYAGSALMVALAIAAAIAALNATATGSLARALPEAGGAYAYGRAYLHRGAGIVAGYAFVIGKVASAGAAALTIGAYAWPGQERLVGLAAVALALALDLRGIVKSVRVTAVLVAFVLGVLGIFVASFAASFTAREPATQSLVVGPASPLAVLASAGILFVAFAGYARVTVLGEEVLDPARTIPRAMVASFAIVIVVYAVIALVVLRALAAGVGLTVAPLEGIAEAFGSDSVAILVRIGAVVAAGGVLLSLIAGVGRTLFAMGRGGDAPRALASVSARTGVPARAEAIAGALAAAVVLIGGIGFALALSAATILAYYAVAHLCVIARAIRGAPRAPWLLALSSGLGLFGCLAVIAALFLALWARVVAHSPAG